MKKIFKILGLIVGVIAMIVVLFFEVAAFDGYIDSKVDKVQTAVQAPPTSITIPTNLGYNASTYCIELTATPDEFVDYFENVLAKDTINQIMISGQRMGNDTRKIKWAIVYNNYKPMQGTENLQKLIRASRNLGALLLFLTIYKLAIPYKIPNLTDGILTQILLIFSPSYGNKKEHKYSTFSRSI